MSINNIIQEAAKLGVLKIEITPRYKLQNASESRGADWLAIDIGQPVSVAGCFTHIRHFIEGDDFVQNFDELERRIRACSSSIGGSHE